MVDRDFYLKMKKVLESEKYTSELLSVSKHSADARRNFIVKSLFFLIGTRDFEGFEYFFNRYYKDIYPFEYLKERTSKSEEEIDDIVYGNMLNNGFLFHITPQTNVDNVLSRGLLNLNDKYGCNLYDRCNRINEVYSLVKDRNEGKEVLRMPSIITIPGFGGFERDRFNNVFLSSNLDYVLKTYGENGELSKMFIRDILWAFGARCDISNLSLDNIKEKVMKSIQDNDISITDKELEELCLYYLDNEKYGYISNYVNVHNQDNKIGINMMEKNISIALRSVGIENEVQHTNKEIYKIYK